jgi:hypothetical protein
VPEWGSHIYRLVKMFRSPALVILSGSVDTEHRLHQEKALREGRQVGCALYATSVLCQQSMHSEFLLHFISQY